MRTTFIKNIYCNILYRLGGFFMTRALCLKPHLAVAVSAQTMEWAKTKLTPTQIDQCKAAWAEIRNNGGYQEVQRNA